MRILTSVLIVIAAGIATVVLAVAGKEGLEWVGADVTGWRRFLIPAVSALIVVYVSFWRIRKSVPVPVGRPRDWALVVPAMIFLVGNLALAHAVFNPMGKAGEWPKDLSLWGFAAAMVVSWHVWEAYKAVRSAERAE